MQLGEGSQPLPWGEPREPLLLPFPSMGSISPWPLQAQALQGGVHFLLAETVEVDG